MAKEWSRKYTCKRCGEIQSINSDLLLEKTYGNPFKHGWEHDDSSIVLFFRCGACATENDVDDSIGCIEDGVPSEVWASVTGEEWT